MAQRIPLRGTLLNTLAVLVGASIGLVFSRSLPPNLFPTALAGLGLVTCVMALRMAMGTQSILIVAGAVAIGALIGAALGITAGLDQGAEGIRHLLGGGGRFNEALLTTSILFCVGPMTLLGCIEDGIEHRIEILTLKSLLDCVAAMVFAATLGPGVLVSAAVVLVVQGTLTLLARPLAGLAQDEALLRETTATGGVLLLGIGMGLAGIKQFPTADFLPALVLTPAFVMLGRKWRRPVGPAQGEGRA